MFLVGKSDGKSDYDLFIDLAVLILEHLLFYFLNELTNYV